MDREPSTDEREEGRISTDRETIRGWADEHGAVPVRHAGGDADEESAEYRVVREEDVGESHERAEWEDFFGQLDDGDHVVVYHGSGTAEPFETARREEIVTRSGLAEEELEERLIEGETITSEVTETTVVESVVVEEATIESELVDSETVDQRVVDVELLERECSGCELIETGERADREWFDEDRYVGSVGDRGSSQMVGGGESTAATGVGSTGGEGASTEPEMGTETTHHGTETEQRDGATGTVDSDMGALESTENVPYSVAFDVEEAWSVTREFVERFTVESRVTGTDVAETDTVEGRDIDVEGLHQSIAQSGMLDLDLTSEEVLSNCTIQTEFDEDDMMRTHFERERVVEDEVVDRKRLEADVTGGQVAEMEIVRTQELVSEIEGESGTGAGGAGMAETEGAETADTAVGTAGAADVGAAGAGADRLTLSDDEVGKTVVDATGEDIGMVSEVEESGEVMRVDAHPGITDRIKAALDWGGSVEDDYPVEVDQIERVTDDQVALKGTEELDEGDSAR